MQSPLAILSLLLATAIVTVTSQCDFCQGGITLPDAVVDDGNGTTCADVPNLDDPTCEISEAYEDTCCPFADADCAFCPDGLKKPDETVEYNGSIITCAQLADAATPVDVGDTCDAIIEAGNSPCCPASAISSMVAFVAAAWMGCIIAFQ